MLAVLASGSVGGRYPSWMVVVILVVVVDGVVNGVLVVVIGSVDGGCRCWFRRDGGEDGDGEL